LVKNWYFDNSEARMTNGLMIQVAREVTAVADSSKFHRRSLSVIDEVSDVHRIITGDGADPKLVAALRARNIEVMVV
jgi:DeoR/GlpR family transcriptional regulator of sugar metabolism